MIDVSKLIPGDSGLVHYTRPDIIQESIALAQGMYEHCFCYIGGFQIIEATATGVRLGDISEYTSDTVLIKRLIPCPTIDQQNILIAYWRSKLNEEYGYFDILELAALLGLQKLGWHDAQRHIIQVPKQTICSQLWIDGARILQPDLIPGMPSAAVDPMMIANCNALETGPIFKP